MYIPKALNAEQQKSVLTVWDAYVKSRLTTDTDMADVQDLMTIRAIRADSPTERAAKTKPMARAKKPAGNGVQVLPVKGEVK